MKKLIIALLFIATTAQAQVVTRQQMKYIPLALTVDTSAYGTGDSIGGKLTFTNAVCSNSSSFVVQSVIIADRSANAVDYDLVLFKSNPSGSTTITDQAAFDPADADLPLILPVIRIEDTDNFAFADNSVSSLSSLSSGGFVTATGGVLYGALVSRGTPTYANAADVTVTLGVICQ